MRRAAPIAGNIPHTLGITIHLCKRSMRCAEPFAEKWEEVLRALGITVSYLNMTQVLKGAGRFKVVKYFKPCGLSKKNHFTILWKRSSLYILIIYIYNKLTYITVCVYILAHWWWLEYMQSWNSDLVKKKTYTSRMHHRARVANGVKGEGGQDSPGEASSGFSPSHPPL